MTTLELFAELDFDLLLLAKQEWRITGDSQVADRATRRLVELRERFARTATYCRQQ